MVASCHQWSVACAAPDLGRPPDVLEHLGWLFESPWQRSAHLGGIAVGPGAFAQSPSSLGVPGVGDRALWASRTGGICCRDQPQACHPVAWGSNPGQVAHVGHQGDGHRAWHPTERRQGVDPWVQPPGGPGLWECLVETREACGVVGHRTDLGLEHAWRRRGRTDDVRAPPEMGRAPMGPARVAAIVSAPARLAATLGVLKSAAGVFTCPAEVAHGVVCPRGAIDRGEIPRARPAGPWHGVPAVGVDAVTGFLGHA